MEHGQPAILKILIILECLIYVCVYVCVFFSRTKVVYECEYARCVNNTVLNMYVLYVSTIFIRLFIFYRAPKCIKSFKLLEAGKFQCHVFPKSLWSFCNCALVFPRGFRRRRLCFVFIYFFILWKVFR